MIFSLTRRVDTPMDEFLRQKESMLNEHMDVYLNNLHKLHVSQFRNILKKLEAGELAQIFVIASKRLRSRIKLHLNVNDKDILQREVFKVEKLKMCHNKDNTMLITE